MAIIAHVRATEPDIEPKTYRAAVVQPDRAQAAAEFQFGIDKPWPDEWEVAFVPEEPSL